MKSEKVNVSTGPVKISKEVQEALAFSPVSHRSGEFHKLYHDVTDLLCQQFNVQNAHLITGSGTAANEAMIWQIKMTGNKGLILSNGEFGSRLIEQCNRAALAFNEHALPWGEIFDIEIIEKEISENEIKWILFCHCETSTGMVNDLIAISATCKRNSCLCFVDCMSTAGTYSLDLSCISMATASSGKGLASVPGLAIVFSNIPLASSKNIPVYFDLVHYKEKGGIPFTISSNLVNALYVSIKQKLQNEQFELIKHCAGHCFSLLSRNNMLPFCNNSSATFTISPHSRGTSYFVGQLMKNKVELSYESEYLKKRDLCQIAFFGYYQQQDLARLLKELKKAIG